MFRIAGALLIVLSSSFLQQEASVPFNPLTVPKRAPALCDTYLVDVNQPTNNPAFRRLLFVSEALSSAENGAKSATASLAKVKGAKNFTEMWTESLNGQQIWEDHMHCAAQIMSRYAPARENDPEAGFTVLLTVAYNQEAHALAQLGRSQKRRLLRKTTPTIDEELSDAEELHQIQNEQNDAGKSITEMGLLAAGQTEDFTEHHPSLQRSLLDCGQQKQIKALLTPVSIDLNSVFGTTANAMLKILTHKTCK